MGKLARARSMHTRWQQLRWRKAEGTVGVQRTWRPSTCIGYGDRILRQNRRARLYLRAQCREALASQLLDRQRENGRDTFNSISSRGTPKSSRRWHET